MAITNGYCTLDALKTVLETGNVTTYDTELERTIESASRFIDNFCNRYFWTNSNQTKYFNATSPHECIVTDLISITTLKTDDDGSRSYNDTWSATDYDLYPLDPKDGEPYTKIVKTPRGNYNFPSYAKGIEIVGDFGWAAVPAAVRGACLIQAERLWMRREAPFGIAGDSRRLGEIHIVAELDPDVKSLLESYRRYVIK
jgi:hypothetical protein